MAQYWLEAWGLSVNQVPYLKLYNHRISGKARLQHIDLLFHDAIKVRDMEVNVYNLV